MFCHHLDYLKGYHTVLNKDDSTLTLLDQEGTDYRTAKPFIGDKAYPTFAEVGLGRRFPFFGLIVFFPFLGPFPNRPSHSDGVPCLVRGSPPPRYH